MRRRDFIAGAASAFVAAVAGVAPAQVGDPVLPAPDTSPPWLCGNTISTVASSAADMTLEKLDEAIRKLRINRRARWNLYTFEHRPFEVKPR